MPESIDATNNGNPESNLEPQNPQEEADSHPVKFAVGGAVQSQAGTYLERPADEDLYEACTATQFSYVLATRQIGKTSLMYETARRLQAEGISSAVVDLNSIGGAAETDQWYLSFTDELARSIGLKADIHSWWQTKAHLTVTRRFLQFLHDVLLAEIGEPVVIFIDEIDMTLGLPFTDDFFAAIRTLYNERAKYPDYQRLTFVLLGVATPDELINDERRTPFNIGRAINLRDFTQEECAPFEREIKRKYPDYDYFEQIYAWTEGHPYLVQKFCKAVIEWRETADPDLIETILQQYFLESEEQMDDNLYFVQSRVLSDRQARKMLRLYKDVLAEEIIEDDKKSIPINRLKLYGLVKVKNGQLQVRNRLYARAFDTGWADEMLSKNTHQELGVPSRYRIVQEIARGGFATIYLAETTIDEEITNVALKVLDPREENKGDMAKLIKRFEREAETVAELDHPNIIPIYDSGRSETGRGGEPALYIAMKYIPNGTLSRKMREEGPLRRDEAVAIIKQVAAALTYAHERGIIHRDVKPTNILLDGDGDTDTDDDKPSRPVLTDFGLVKRIDKNDPSFTTRPLGTSRYMAPEQLAPKRWKMPTSSPATDIYALGITFFEMLAGRHPFETDSDHEMTSPEFITRHLSDDPLPRLSSVMPSVGLFFDDVLIKATAKEPDERFESVADFVEALETANNQAKQHLAQPLIMAAENYEQNHELDSALDMIERALEIDPENVEALRVRGKIKKDQGFLPEALDIYQQAYERENDPASATGQDYLDILKRVAQNAWRDGDVQQTIAYYTIITDELDKGRSRGMDMRAWEAVWSELMESHYQAGENVYSRGTPDNLAQVTEMLEREMLALQSLRADHERRDLQAKLRLLKIQYHYAVGDKAYAAGSPENMVEAINILKREAHALQELEANSANQDLEEKLRSLRIKGHYQAGNEVYAAGQPTDFGEAIKTLTRKIHALEQLGAEKERDDLYEKLKLCHYGAGDHAYAAGEPADLEEAMAVLEREIAALDALKAETQSQDLREKLRLLRVKQHYQRANEVYAGSRPDDLDAAIQILKEEIQHLEALDAAKEKQDLERKRKNLQVTYHKTLVETLLTDIGALKTQFPKNEPEGFFQRYEGLDAAYLDLIELDPGNNRWPRDRRQKLKERAEHRLKLARRAAHKYDYETALRHYRAIQDIEQTKGYDGLSGELNLDLPSKITKLEEKAEYEAKYQEIVELAEENHIRALERLTEDFISKGVYEHRQVAKYLWQLVYAKQHDGQLPPELQNEVVLANTRQELDETRQALNETKLALNQTEETVAEKEAELANAQAKIEEKSNILTETEKELRHLHEVAATQERELTTKTEQVESLERKIRTYTQQSNDNVVSFIIPSVVIGGVIGILVGMIFPSVQSLLVLAPITVIALVIIVVFYRTTTR